MTLTEFLLARTVEDEAAARRLLRYAQENELACREPQMLGKRIPGWHEWPDVQAMCTRTLAECDAKRRIVSAHWGKRPWQGTFADCQECGLRAPCRTVQLLALPYADRPDYSPEWRPPT